MRTQDQDDALNQLYGEHDHALRHLEVLERSGRSMAESGATPERLAEFRSAVEFLDHEVRAHNEWEENHLFPILEIYTGPGGPCSIMRAEHRALWDAYGAIGPLLARAQAGAAGPEELEQLASAALSVVDLLGGHIQKENEILFPMARRMLLPEHHRKLASARG